MKIEFAKLFALSISTLLFACGGDDPSAPGPGDGDDEPATSTRIERASLEAAVPANGAVVRGDFLLGAIVDAQNPVVVRFLIDGVEVGIINEHPYQLALTSCDLTVGNHAYVVMIEDEAGNRDHAEQFFETNCD